MISCLFSSVTFGAYFIRSWLIRRMEPAIKKQKTENVISNQENGESKMETSADADPKVDVTENSNNENCSLENEESSNLNVSENRESNAASNNKEAEQKVGMELCLNDIHFEGIVKQRYSDFMVRECDLSGKPVHLTDTEHLDKNKEEEKEPPAPPPCPIEDQALLEKIEKFASNESEDKTQTMEFDVVDDKEHRKLVHLFIKTKYSNIETGTKTLESGTRVIVLSFRNSKDKRNRRDKRQSIPKYCQFTLFKQNKDTMECINLIANMLRINTCNFSYAGTKDRRATTVQRISVQRTFSKRLHDLNKRLWNVRLGNFEYGETGLKLGDLSGNEFTLVIRDVSKCSEEDVDKACTSLKENGFINYFGLQRFGTGAVPTQDIGKALLKSNFEEACNLILSLPQDTTSNYQPREREALKIWSESKDAEKAYRAVKQKRSNEGKILEGLKKLGGTNFLDAMKTLPRNMRLLYLHSYQSLVWNKSVSYRIKEFGTKPIKGDLVLAEKDENGFQQAKVLEEADIESNKYTIEDIVLPLPGYDVIYPSNSCFDYMKQLMEEDGLDITNMRRPQKELSLSGAYRTMIIKPKAVEWQLIRYDNFTLPLLQNDIEKMETKENADDTTVGVADGKYLALKLQMTLPSSCYATTALRELLASDSSFKSQVQLNEKFYAKTTK